MVFWQLVWQLTTTLRTDLITHRNIILGQCKLQKGSSIQKRPPGLCQLLSAAMPCFFGWGTNT